jgi:hypothetical protein
MQYFRPFKSERPTVLFNESFPAEGMPVVEGRGGPVKSKDKDCPDFRVFDGKTR